MSEAIKEEYPASDPAATTAAANATAKGSAPTECVDLTLTDSDDDDNAQQDHGGVGDYTKFWKRGTSLRKRSGVSITKTRPDDDAEDDDDITPKVVTPRRKKQKKKKSTAASSSGSGSSSSSVAEKYGDCVKEVGAIGYSFHKLFHVVEGKNKKTEMFHGEVVGIINKALAKNGKDRRCLYEDGDSEDLSLEDLQDLQLHPCCTDKNCTKISTNSIEKRGPAGGKVTQVTQEESEAQDEKGSPSNLEGGASASDDDLGGSGGINIDKLFYSSSSDDDSSILSRSISSNPVEIVTNSENSGIETSRISDVNKSPTNPIQGGTENDSNNSGDPQEELEDDGEGNPTNQEGATMAKVINNISNPDDDKTSLEIDDDGSHEVRPDVPQEPKDDHTDNSRNLANNKEDISNPSENEISKNAEVDLSNDEEDIFSSSDDDEGDEINLDKNSGNKPNDNKDIVLSDDDEDIFASSDDDKGGEDNEDVIHSDDEEDIFASSDDDQGGDEMNSRPNENSGSDPSDLQTHHFLSSAEFEDKFDAHAASYPVIGNPDDENESTCSRFSDVSDYEFGTNERNACGEYEKKPKEKLKPEKAKSLMKGYVTPPVMRFEPECYYFMLHWGERMQVRAWPLGHGPPESKFRDHGINYELLYSKLITKKGKGYSEDSMGKKYYKSYYLAVSGRGMKKIDIRRALLSIGDFESITYEHGAHKTQSRLKLLASPSCQINKHFCMHELQQDQFELIEDRGHLGCGFIPPDLLVKLLGKTARAQRVFAVQVRIIGPATVGIAKGMLVVKDGIEKIQVPSSMVKVEKSKSSRPLHNTVVLNIKRLHPTVSQWQLGRLFSEDEKDPTDRQKGEFKSTSDEVIRVLLSKGVHMDVINQYKEDFKEQIRFNHGNLVGVSDPTGGGIPSGHVFITGMGKKTPSRVFLTRSPCTESKDGIVVKVASYQDMPRRAFKSLNELGFGAVVFSLDEELPTKINDGDLDGDFYICIWDNEVLEGIIDVEDEGLGEILTDDVVSTEFIHEMNGEEYDSMVVQKLQEDPDLYQVKTGPGMKTTIELTRDQIYQGRDFITHVLGHQSIEQSKEGSERQPKRKKENRKKKKSCVNFRCQWGCGKSDWISTEEIRKTHAGPPLPLMSYIQTNGLLRKGLLPEMFSKWIKENLDEEDIEEIVNHKTTVHGKIKVLCRYGDGEEVWMPIEDTKEDCKIFLGAYAKKKNLFGKPGWEDVDGYWHEELIDLMCTQTRSNEIGNLRNKLHKKWGDAFVEFGWNHPDTILWGRAYKESNNIETHDVVLKLPEHLRRELPDTLKKFVVLK